MALKLEILLEAVDRLSAPIERIRARVAALTGPINAVSGATARLSRAANFDRLAGSLGTVAARARETAGAIAAVSGRAALLGTGTGLAGLAIFRGSFLRTAADFEDIREALTTATGSEAGGRAAFDWSADFAERTPYQLREVADAYAALGAVGADAQRFMQPIGDAAAAFRGRSLMQAVEAFTDALTGEFERLKEFGITASHEGRNVTLEYMKDGRTLRVTMDANNRAMIASQLAAIWNDRYRGAMARRSRTWRGMVSTLSDTWDRWKAAVMDAGPFDWLKGQLDMLLSRVGLLNQDGTAQGWAARVGQAMLDAGEAMKVFAVGGWRVNDMMAPDGVERVPSAFERLSAPFTRLGEVLDWLRARLEPITGPIGALEAALIGVGAVLVGPLIANVTALGMAFAALAAVVITNPLAAGILALAGGALLIWTKWDGIAEWLGRQWEDLKAFGERSLRSLVDGPLNDLRNAASWVRDAWQGIAGFFGGVASGIGDALSGAGAAAVDDMVALATRLRTGWDGIAGFFGGVASGIGDALSGAGAAAVDGMVALATRLRADWGELVGLFERVARGISDVLGSALRVAEGPVRTMSGLFGTMRDAWAGMAEAAERLLGLAPRLPEQRAPELGGGIRPGDREGIGRFNEGLPFTPTAPDTPSRRMFQPSGARIEDLPRLMQPSSMPSGFGGRDAKVDLGGTLRIRVEDGRVVTTGRLNDPRARLDFDQGLLVGPA